MRKSLAFYVLSIFYLFGFGIDHSFSQDLVFERYSTKDGLNQSSIIAAYQDEDGFIWFGTYAGLNRYDGYNFVAYRYNYINTHSVSAMHVRSICQDKSGILFVATTTGLNRFFIHTKENVNYSHDPNDPNSLANNTIYKILKDNDGDVWLGTWGGGLDKLKRMDSIYTDEQNAKYQFIHHIPDSNKNSIGSLFISDMTEAPDGTIWIATNNGVDRFNKNTNTFKHYRHKPNNPNSLSMNDISSICIDKKGFIWIGTWEGGLNILNPKTDKFIHYRYNPKNNNSISHNIIKSIFCDSNGSLWIGTWGGGLNKVIFPKDMPYSKAIENITFSRFENNTADLNSISGNSIYSIFEDRSGFLWIGTDWAGLNRLNVQEPKFRHFYAEKSTSNNLVNNIIHSMVIDENHNLWIGTENGLNIYNKKTNSFVLYQNKPNDTKSLSHNYIRSLLKDHNNGIWVGTENGLNKFNKETNDFKRFDYIFSTHEKGIVISLHESSDHDIWLGTYGDGLIRFNVSHNTFKKYTHNPDDTTSISSNIIWDIVEDHDRNIWIGTEDGGLCKFDPGSDKFITYKHNSKKSSLSNNLVMSLFIDHNDSLWVGTRNKLNKLTYDENHNVIFKKYSTHDGLTSETIIGMVEDDSSNLWLTSTKGITRFNPENKTYSKYYAEDGLQDNQFSINCIVYDSIDHDIYAGGIKGFNLFNTEQIKKNEPIPKSKIVDLKLFHQSVEIGEKIDNKIILTEDICYLDTLELSYKNSIVSFEYTALLNPYSQSNVFAYKLDGYDKDWNYVSSQRLATYRNIPPGKYLFKVKAGIKDGKWEDHPSKLFLYIKPPWWGTTFFRISVIIILVSLVILIYLVRIRFLKNRQKELQIMVNKRTEELRKANSLLEEKQEEISLQNEELVKHRNDLENLVQERTKELMNAKLKAEESDKLKSAFLANMSHEIRTPMNALIGFSSLLVDEDMSNDQKAYYAKVIKNSGNTLLTLINDILDISTIQANQLVIYKDNFCVEDELPDLLAYFTTKNDKNIDIQLIKENSKEKTWIYNDVIRFKQIMTNLIGNALKFTDEGHIYFGHRIRENMVEFFVEDTGIGISKEDQESIFNYFYKIEKDKNKFYDGTGLGLSISKSLVSLMGGELKIESKKGKGTTIYFDLPKSTSPGVNFHQEQTTLKTITLKDLSILIAEDEPYNYELMHSILNKTMANIFWAKNGQEAVDFIKEFDPNKKCIVLMDIKMPVIDGIEATRLIKEINSRIPVIAVTAFAQAGDRIRIMNNNFDDYISKPINTAKMLEMVYNYYNQLT